MDSTYQHSTHDLLLLALASARTQAEDALDHGTMREHRVYGREYHLIADCIRDVIGVDPRPKE